MLSSITGAVSCACTYNGDTWDGRWEDPSNVHFANFVRSNSVLKSRVNNAAYDNWNNNQDTIEFVASNKPPRITVENVDFSSVEWTGRAKGASNNWDSKKHYIEVEIMLNEGKGIMDYDDDKLLGLIAHEFGHAVGLKHQNNSNYLMYCYDSRKTNVLSSAEKTILEDHYD